MTTVYRTRRGNWRVCHIPKSLCRHRFHLPGMTPKEAAQLPYGMLLQLLEVVDAPHEVTAVYGTKLWYDYTFIGRQNGIGRSHDLPAVIDADGSMSWWRKGDPYRPSGRPTSIRADGTRVYYSKAYHPGAQQIRLIRGTYWSWEEKP